VVLVLTGHLLPAVVLGVVLAGYLQARVVAPDLAHRIDLRLARVAVAIGQVVATVVSWALLGIVFALVFVPVWLLGLVRRRPFGGRNGARWTSRVDGPLPRRTFGREPADPVGRSPLFVRAMAVVAVVAAIDLVAGAVLPAIGVLPQQRGTYGADVQQAIRTTMAAPANGDAEWTTRFAEDMGSYELSNPGYVPFLIRGHHAFSSPYLNTTDQERRSYVQADRGGAAPLRVAFFGGSVMFGVGQRDEHTIPSEFARVAEAAGVAVEVHNYGFPGWVAWQEFHDLERLLAAGESYDLIVFYDGFNEFSAQTTDYSPEPTHFGATILQGIGAEYQHEREDEPAVFDGLADLWSTYRENSAVASLVEVVRDEEGDDHLSGATPEQQTDAALDIYARATDRIADLTRDAGTPLQFFWQPRKPGWPTAITDRLAPDVVNLAGIFDGREEEIYIDEVHTNEMGARIAAEAIWDELGADLEAAP
jgi:lysophospholipase L1-like esterase